MNKDFVNVEVPFDHALRIEKTLSETSYLRDNKSCGKRKTEK